MLANGRLAAPEVIISIDRHILGSERWKKYNKFR